MRRFAVMTGLIALLSGCALSQAELDITYMKIITEGSPDTVIVQASGEVTGEIQIRQGISTAIQAMFFRSDSTQENGVNEPDYRLDVFPLQGGVLIFNRTGAFTGTLDGSADTLTSANFTLYRTFDDQEQIGPFAVPIRIQP